MMEIAVRLQCTDLVLGKTVCLNEYVYGRDGDKKGCIKKASAKAQRLNDKGEENRRYWLKFIER